MTMYVKQNDSLYPLAGNYIKVGDDIKKIKANDRVYIPSLHHNTYFVDKVQYIACSNDKTIARATTLTDWQYLDVEMDLDIEGIAYGNGLFVRVDCSRYIYYSVDGRYWKRGYFAYSSNFQWSLIKYLNNEFIACTLNGDIAYSTNGVDWNITDCNINICDITYGKGIYVGTGNYGNIYHSIDKINWQSVNIDDSMYKVYVVYTRGAFYAVSSNGKLMMSTDAINWIMKSTGEYSWRNIATDGFSFLAVGKNGHILNGMDLNNWEVIDVGDNDWNAVTFCDNKWVIVGNAGKMAYSTNCINWTLKTLGYRDWIDICAVK